MSKAWSHLPNAHHIDWVLASLKENPELWDAARDAISALVAYDDCDQFLNMPYEKLKVWTVLSEDPRAVLLLPMVYVKEKLANLNLQPA